MFIFRIKSISDFRKVHNLSLFRFSDTLSSTPFHVVRWFVLCLVGVNSKIELPNLGTKVGMATILHDTDFFVSRNSLDQN